MKKIFFVLLGIVISSEAMAKDGVYLGADLLRTNAKHKLFIKQGLSNIDITYMEGNRKDNDSIGVGINLGYKATVANNVYVAPELFYDYIGNSSKDFYYLNDPNSRQDTIDINSRFGAKINLGVAIIEKVNLFVNAGVTDVSYTVRWNSAGRSRGSHKIAMIYGLGASYDINEQWVLKAAYDRQNFNIQYIDEGQRSNVTLSTFKLGMAYNF